MNTTLKYLRPSELAVEASAQRSYDAARAQKIADEYDPDDLGHLEVSLRDGRYWVVDGQHRRGALLILGKDEPVPCVVVPSDSVQVDAKRFVARNAKNRRPNIVDLYHVSVVAGEPEAVAIAEVVKGFDLQISMGGGQNDISAVGALRWVYRRDGTGKLLARTLALIEKTWGRERSSRDGAILKAMAYLLDKRGNKINVDSLAEKLQREATAARLLGVARGYRAATRKSLWLQVADVMVEIYNKGRTTRRIAL